MMIWMSRLVSIALMCTLATARTPHARNYHPRTNSIDVKATSATDLDESWIPRRRALKRTKEKESSSGDLGEIFDESNEEQEDKAWTVNIEISITTDSPTISPTHTPTISPTHTPTISPTNYPTGSPTPKPSPTPTKEPTGVPTLFPTPIPQKITTLSCQSIDPSSSADVNNENVTIYFTYIVETNTTTIDESVEQTIIDELGSSISSSIVEDHCAGSRLLLRITNHRRLEITGVTSKPQDIKTGTCTPEKSESKSCTTFQGAVTILYTKEGNNKTPQEIDKNALDTIQENMNNGKYMKDVNEGLVGTKVNVTDIVYTNADTVPVVAVAEADEGAHHSRTYITPGGRTAIAFFVLVFIIINLLWCFCCKKKRGASSSPEHEQKGDSKSVSTGSGTHDDSAEEENSYITSDYNDLGKHHSKIDVHRCQSVMCKTCRPVIPHDGPLATIDEDDQLQEDRYLTSQTPIPRESIEKKSVRFIRIPGPQTPVHDVRAGDSFEDASDLTSLDDSFFFEESIRKEFEDSIRKEGTRRPEHEYVGEI